MTKKRENFYVGDPASEKAVRRGLRWLASWGDPRQPGTLVVPTKRNFRTSSLASIIGDAAGRILEKGQPITISGRQIRGYTLQTLPRRFGSLGPTLVLWPGKKGMDKVHDTDASALCVVPWVDENIATWRSAVGAVDLLRPSTPAMSATVADPVVDAALRSLTRRINLSTGLAHPRDKTAAVGMFRILKKAGYQWTGPEFSARAISLGWKAEDARDLGKMAKGTMEGRSFRAPGARETWARDILKQWRQAAQAK